MEKEIREAFQGLREDIGQRIQGVHARMDELKADMGAGFLDGKGSIKCLEGKVIEQMRLSASNGTRLETHLEEHRAFRLWWWTIIGGLVVAYAAAIGHIIWDAT